MTVLHRQLDELVAYPSHPPRTESKTYVRTHHHLIYDMDAPCWICGVRHSDGGAMETHHYRFEWASQFGLDLAKVEADFPDLTDRAKLAEWVDGEGNMLVLCLPGDESVLMADGTERRLDRVQRGDRVIGHDGLPHRVTDTMSRLIDEEIVEVDGRRMTANHPVLTVRGWLPAGLLACGDLALHVGVGVPQVLGLGCVEAQVLDAIVEPVPVDVVNALARREATPEVLLHHEAMLHDRSPLVTVPDPHSAISPRREGGAKGALCAPAREFVQSAQATGTRAEPLLVGRALDDGATSFARDGRRVDALGSFAARAGAVARTRGVAIGDLRCDEEGVAADSATAGDSNGALDAWWRPIHDIRRVPFAGRVHDITVACSHSFVTRGLVVHNCAVHHRSKYEGIHEITYPAWLLQRYQGDEFTFIEQHAAPRAHTPLMAKGDPHPAGPPA